MYSVFNLAELGKIDRIKQYLDEYDILIEGAKKYSDGSMALLKKYLS